MTHKFKVGDKVLVKEEIDHHKIGDILTCVAVDYDGDPIFSGDTEQGWGWSGWGDFFDLYEEVSDKGKNEPQTDNVNHPPHYTSHPSGVEAIEITRWLRGPYSNACKYVMRGWDGLKGDPVEDLRKALWYLDDAEKFPDDGMDLHPGADIKWYEYYEAEACEEKRECIGCILIASEIEEHDNPPSETIHAAKKLIQDRIAALQSGHISI